MTHIIRTGQGSARTIAINGRVERQLDQIQLIAEVAKVGMDAVADIYTYSEFKAVNALVTTELYRQALEQSTGGLTPAEARTYLALRQQFLEQMAAIAQITGASVIQDIADNTNGGARRAPRTRLFGD